MPRPILVVEDDSGIREMLVDCLTDAGYATVEATNGLAALGLLRDGLDPSLILLDLVMPLMNGQEFLYTWRDEGLAKNAPVVILTADQREHDFASTLGGASVLTKPMELDTLLAVVERCARPDALFGQALQRMAQPSEPAGSC
jgi:CheY-like chemotaxis protein